VRGVGGHGVVAEDAAQHVIFETRAARIGQHLEVVAGGKARYDAIYWLVRELEKSMAVMRAVEILCVSASRARKEERKQ
jgi:hypothetical protein